MSIGISEEHVELAASLRRWAAGSGGIEATRVAEDDPAASFDEAWKSATEMGVTTIGLPEAAGGGGGSVLDVAVALEACAHELVPGPLLSAAVAASLLGGSDVAAELGEGARVALALHPDLRLVADLPGATHVLLPDADGAWHLVPASAAHRPAGRRLRPDPPVRHRGRGRPHRRRRPARPRHRAGAPGARHLRRGGGRRRRAVVPRDGRRVRQGAGAVRQADRRLPGHQAPVRRDARDGRVGHRRGLGRRLGGVRRRRAARPVALRRRRRPGHRVRRRGRGRQVLHPGARWHRVHLRARRAPLPATGPRAAGARRRPGGRRRAAHRGRGGRRPARGRGRPRGPRRGRARRRPGRRRAGRRGRGPTGRPHRDRLPDAALAARPPASAPTPSRRS